MNDRETLKTNKTEDDKEKERKLSPNEPIFTLYIQI